MFKKEIKHVPKFDRLFMKQVVILKGKYAIIKKNYKIKHCSVLYFS